MYISATSQCIFDVLSVDHGSGMIGKYFNFDIAVVDAMLGRDNWSGHNFNIYNSRTQQVKTVIMWRVANGGSNGDGHGRENDGTSKEDDFQTGDKISFVDITTFCQSSKCPLNVLSIDHGSGLVGQYFNFDKDIVDRILDRNNWSSENFIVYNARTKYVNKVIMWRSNGGGLIGDGHGRENDGTAQEGDFQAGDQITILNTDHTDPNIDCLQIQNIDKSSLCIFDVLSVDHISGLVGQYFNFDKSIIDTILGRDDWNGDNFDIYNLRSQQIKKVKIWRAANGGSNGDGHGREDDGTSKEDDFQTGDKIAIVNIQTFCESSQCPLEVLSIDHGSGTVGKYFNFDKNIVDGMLGRDDWTNENFLIYNSRTLYVTKVIMWRSNGGGSIGDGHGRENDGTTQEGDFEVGDEITILNEKKGYNECLRVDIENNIGSITVNDDGSIQENTDNVNNADLFCGTNDDKPLWTALLSLNQDLLNKLIELKGVDSLQGIFEYIQCSEFVYYAVSRASVPGPTQSLELTNKILEILQNIPGMDDIIGDSVDEISKFIVNLLDEFTPDEIGLQWNDYYTPNGKIFNPFDLLQPLAQFLSTSICDVLVTGDNLNTMLENLKNSDSIKELQQLFNENIYGFLTDDANILYDDNLKTELLNNDFYKEFTFVMTVGMQICFSKGMNGCITRMHGVATNLKGESKIIDSRSMYIEFPTFEYGLSSSGFVHFDFMSSLNAIIRDELSVTVGVSAKTPGSKTFSNYKEQWESHSGRSTRIPFIGDAASITVDFVNGKLEDNSLIVDILNGGSNARLAVLYAINNNMNCNGFRVDLKVGEYDIFGGSIMFGYEYRKEGTGTVKQNIKWIDDVNLPNYNDMINIMMSISTETINILPDAMNYVNNFAENLGQQILDEGMKSVKNVLNEAIDIIEDIANVGIDVANVGIDGLNEVINGANKVVDGANSVAKTANNVKNDITEKYDDVSKVVNGAKNGCKAIGDACLKIGVCADIPLFGRKCINVEKCVGDFIPIDDTCNDIFSPITTADNTLKKVIDKIPDIPTIPKIPNVGSIDSIEIADIDAKTDNLLFIDDNYMDNRKGDILREIVKNNIDIQLPDIIFEIPPIFYVICIMLALMFFLMGIFVERYCLSQPRYQAVSKYMDTDIEQYD